MRPRSLVALATLVLVLAACNDPNAPVPVADRLQRHLIDAQGRAIILRGINVSSSSKSAPDRQPTISEAEIAQMSIDAGFRFVRHLVFWSAIEPIEGTYDETYLDRVGQWLDLYAAHGVRVLLDMHQDIFAHAPTWGNGAPIWALQIALDGDVPTLPTQSVWSNAYYLPDVTRAFDRFFGYEPGYRALQDHYAAAWRHVAKRFAGHPALIGYDLMNEPFPGSAWDPLELGISQFESSPSYAFDREKLGPFYQRVVDEIRKEDPDTYVFYEPRFGTPGNGSRSYLAPLHDPRAGESRLVLAPHMYSVAFEGMGHYVPTDTSVDRFEASRAYEIREANVPLVIGEWGLDQTLPGGLYLTDREAESFDRLEASWAYWSFDLGTQASPGWAPFYRTGDPTTPLGFQPNADILIRVYPLATAGYLRSFHWDRASRTFTMRFDSVTGVTGVAPTEIFVPNERFYPNGFSVAIGDTDPTAVDHSFDDANNVLTVNVDPSNASHVVTVTPNDVP